MMRPSSLALGVLGALGVLPSAGCPGPEGNPTTLWLSPVGTDETHVQLVDTEPPPF
jgi:hypothetical protein